MKKINFLAFLMVIAVFMISFNNVSAQSEVGNGKTKIKIKSKPYIAEFDDGRTLTSTDIKFLNSISNGKGEREATIKDKTYKVGQKLDVNSAAALNKAKSDFRRSHKMEKATDAKTIDKSRSQETCYWYLYCDDYGNCYYVWYCD